jgi:hypothetical protein
MKNGANGLADREPSLISLYMELAGAEESAVRGVFMYVCDQDEAGRSSEKDGNEILGRQEGRLRAFGLDLGVVKAPKRPWQLLPMAGGV